MKKNISKQTLSFLTSKSMKYLRTPIDIWESISKEFAFTLDACASHQNHLLPKYYTKEDDCLKQDWKGEIVYCHPLFDMHIGKFVEKCATEKCMAIMLIPSSTHTRYFHKFIWDKKNHKPKQNVEVRFLEKPTKGFRFLNDDGSGDNDNLSGYIKPLMIVIFRNDAQAHENVAKEKKT